ncbi:hypothetical protein H5P28_18185 [Ruficoccus amylovorans]|uniref:Core-binding (CB) domain-containing protein n=1 Tax=Ruficoccus amylovorans TaxID=1804625 RepID=A0A842HM82_9BACT|nr:hypothetical protein [Ruficoccus amylovorans]MBC2596201.1 hypothetical protein [Ruficoccus amylovorans]
MSTSKKARQPGSLKVGECLYRHETSGTYYALVKSNGKQIRRSLKTNDFALAKRRLREFREKIGRLDLSDGKSKILFPELAEKWRATLAPHLKPSSTLRRDSSIVQLNRFFGQQLARTVTRAMCEDWAQARSPQIAASTFNNERDTLIAIFEYARREGIILDNPAEVLPRRKQPKPAILIPTREQYESLLKTMRGMDNRY